jgi:hypothetical protein
VPAVGRTDVEEHRRASKTADLEDQRSRSARDAPTSGARQGKPQKKSDPSQEQEQAQAQANLQAQLQGQGQGQGQGQLQFAVQSLDSKSENENKNDNKNSNENTNENKVDNSVDNKVNNNIDNNVENTVDNKVNVDVNVDLDLKATGLSSPVIDLTHFSATDSLIMPEVVNQTLNGNGNQFNLDQVNNLIDNDTLTNPQVSFSGSSFEMDAKAEGGESKIDSKMGDVVGAAASGIAASAAANLTQSAFDQTITQGANIQFNSMTIQAAGHDLTDDHHLGA